PARRSPRAPARCRSSPRATSTTCSVSGRGTSTRRSTVSSSVRNGHVPSTYCNGSPRSRRAASSRQPSEPAWSRIQRASRTEPSRSASSASSAADPKPTGSAVIELPVPLVGHEGIGQLVEVAHEDAVELVQRELDPVVGDPVLLVIVGPDLLRTAPAADLAPALFGHRG